MASCRHSYIAPLFSPSASLHMLEFILLPVQQIPQTLVFIILVLKSHICSGAHFLQDDTRSAQPARQRPHICLQLISATFSCGPPQEAFILVTSFSSVPCLLWAILDCSFTCLLRMPTSVFPLIQFLLLSKSQTHSASSFEISLNHAGHGVTLAVSWYPSLAPDCVSCRGSSYTDIFLGQ